MLTPKYQIQNSNIKLEKNKQNLKFANHCLTNMCKKHQHVRIQIQPTNNSDHTYKQINMLIVVNQLRNQYSTK